MYIIAYFCLIHQRYADEEDTMTQRLDGLPDGGNLVMRRIVQQVKGHRVVVMEVGPSDRSSLSEDDNTNELNKKSAMEESTLNRFAAVFRNCQLFHFVQDERIVRLCI